MVSARPTHFCALCDVQHICNLSIHPIGKGRDVDQLINWELCFHAQLSLYNNRAMQHPRHTSRVANPYVDVPFPSSLTHEKDP